MKIIVDTGIWSLALRRQTDIENSFVSELQRLILDHRVIMIGPIRQEILSGIRYASQFRKMAKAIESFPDFPIFTEDYVNAAAYFNTCRSRGIQGSNTDFLICAITDRNNFSIYTTDKDFVLFSEHIPISLHKI